METRGLIFSRFLAVTFVCVLVIGGASLLNHHTNQSAESKLNGRESQLRSAVLHERTADVISLLESAKNPSEIHDMADAISQDGSRVSHSVLVDGRKETVMFYHSHGTDGFQPVAGIVLDRPKTK